MKSFVRLALDRNGATAAEFALVLPLLLFFLFGIIDVGRLMWTFNQAEKATQIGVRAAVVTNVIPTKLNDDFATTYNLVGGDPVQHVGKALTIRPRALAQQRGTVGQDGAIGWGMGHGAAT